MRGCAASVISHLCRNVRIWIPPNGNSAPASCVASLCAGWEYRARPLLRPPLDPFCIGINEGGPRQNSGAQIRSGQIGPREVAEGKIQTIQVLTREVSLPPGVELNMCAREPGPHQAGPREVGLCEVCPGKIRPCQVCPGQIGIRQIRLLQLGLAELGRP